MPAPVALAALVAACGTDDPGGSSRSPGPWDDGAVLPAEAQSVGDAVRGRHLLLNGDFMSCGIPYRLYADPALGGTVAGGFGSASQDDRIEGREGKNAELPYSLNVFTSPDGAEVVNQNCLSCHGGRFDGKVVLGLGNATADFTSPLGGDTSLPLTDAVLDALGLTEAEKANLLKLYGRARVIGKVTAMRTVGMNPAEMLAVILMSHHDRDTLAWSDEPVTSVVVRDHDGNPIEDPRVTSDPPPWWRANKKNALFYNGMARGDHRGTMALATSVCVDTVERAREVDDMFRDIQAFILTVRPPEYSRAVDAALAERGSKVFAKSCAGCHGTYGATEEDDTYPNLLLPLDVIGTDPAVAEAGTVHAPELVDWYNGSFYGEITRMEPNDPFAGYVAPPLDGIWATAPYLHNASVPTVELVLNSKARPTYWKRVDYDSKNFDEDAMGWPWLETGPQASAPAEEQKYIYDTTYFSQSNRGHTFGDHLTSDERRAVIEYLKTL